MATEDAIVQLQPEVISGLVSKLVADAGKANPMIVRHLEQAAEAAEPYLQTSALPVAAGASVGCGQKDLR